jgi:DNA-binding NtrC family response regulator
MMRSTGRNWDPSDADLVWVGESAPVQWVKTQLREAAATDLPVLLVGELGTGRRLAARTLHHLSPRSSERYVHFDCSAAHPARVDRELFGGLPAKALEPRPTGRCERAQGGTLLLEDVDDLPATTQTRLLGCISTAELSDPGVTAPIPLDVRWVAATQRDLGQLSRAGVFCAELYYRLAVVPIKLPPLRERRADIPMLANYFGSQCAAAMCRPGCRISRAAMQALLDHEWPGNVWELKRTLERAVVLAGGQEILPQHVHLPMCTIPRNPRAGFDPGDTLIGIVPPGSGGHPELN